MIAVDVLVNSVTHTNCKYIKSLENLDIEFIFFMETEIKSTINIEIANVTDIKCIEKKIIEL